MELIYFIIIFIYNEWVKFMLYKSLVGLVVIGVELNREDHGSIPAIVIGEGLESLNTKTEL
jgi:hypothetical protein